jgi:hypothetical protein
MTAPPRVNYENHEIPSEYRTAAGRTQSYRDWLYLQICPRALAKAGFFTYPQNIAQIVECSACGMLLSNLDKTHSPQNDDHIAHCFWKDILSGIQETLDTETPTEPEKNSAVVPIKPTPCEIGTHEASQLLKNRGAGRAAQQSTIRSITTCYTPRHPTHLQQRLQNNTSRILRPLILTASPQF